MRGSPLRRYLHRVQRGKCHYCSMQMSIVVSGKFFCTVDHKLPISEGGSNMIDNLVGACFTCNNMRGTIPYWAFQRFVSLYGNSEPVRAVMRRLTVEEYQRQKAMWDAIHGFKTDQASIPAERRPYLSQLRNKLGQVTYSMRQSKRNAIWSAYLKQEMHSAN